MAGRPSRCQPFRRGAVAVGVGLTDALTGCSLLRGCSSAEIFLRAELVGTAPEEATAVDAADPWVANSLWVPKVVEATAEDHPRESSVTDRLSDYDALRADLDVLSSVDRSGDRLYYVRADGQVTRPRAAFFAGDDARQSELVLPPACQDRVHTSSPRPSVPVSGATTARRIQVRSSYWPADAGVLRNVCVRKTDHPA